MGHTPDRRAEVQSTNTTPADNRDSVSQSLDAIFELLAPEPRRRTLYVLYRRSGPIPVADLADAVASTCGVGAERVTVKLHHVHLPKLAEAGVVAYDHEAETVALGDVSPRLDRYLAAAAEDESEPFRRAAECATLSEF